MGARIVPVTGTGEVTTAVVAGGMGTGDVICTVGGLVAAALTVTVPLATPVLPAASQALAWKLYEGVVNSVTTACPLASSGTLIVLLLASVSVSARLVTPI